MHTLLGLSEVYKLKILERKKYCINMTLTNKVWSATDWQALWIPKEAAGRSSRKANTRFIVKKCPHRDTTERRGKAGKLEGKVYQQHEQDLHLLTVDRKARLTAGTQEVQSCEPFPCTPLQRNTRRGAYMWRWDIKQLVQCPTQQTVNKHLVLCAFTLKLLRKHWLLALFSETVIPLKV